MYGGLRRVDGKAYAVVVADLSVLQLYFYWLLIHFTLQAQDED